MRVVFTVEEWPPASRTRLGRCSGGGNGGTTTGSSFAICSVDFPGSPDLIGRSCVGGLVGSFFGVVCVTGRSGCGFSLDLPVATTAITIPMAPSAKKPATATMGIQTGIPFFGGRVGSRDWRRGGRGPAVDAQH